MQFCYFSEYIAFFIAGTLAYRHSWLTTLATSTGKRWGRIGLLGGLLFWFALLILGGALKGQAATYSGGWHWQSAGMAGWHGEALLKFLIATLLSIAATYALSALVFRRIPVLKNIL